jgi:hypothetical protein
MGWFEEPISRQWVIPMSTPLYFPALKYSTSPIQIQQFIIQVMGEVSKGFAEALVARGQCLWEVADVFKHELDEKEGICHVNQTIWACKQS